MNSAALYDNVDPGIVVSRPMNASIGDTIYVRISFNTSYCDSSKHGRIRIIDKRRWCGLRLVRDELCRCVR